MNYMGIDYHKQYSQLTLMDSGGNIIKSGRVLNKHREIECFLQGYQQDTLVVIEAGRSSYTMVDLLPIFNT